MTDMTEATNPFAHEQAAPRVPAPESRASLSLPEVMKAIKDGNLDQAASRLLRGFRVQGERRAAFIEQLSAHEGVSPAFAVRFLEDEAFRRRVIRLCDGFSRHGERMERLEEAEIFMEIMESGKDDITPLLQSTNPGERFKGMRVLPRHELVAKRLLELRDELVTSTDRELVEPIIAYLQELMDRLGLGSVTDDASWQALAESGELFGRFTADPYVRELYTNVTGGQSFDQIGRRIQLYRRTREDGSTTPTLAVNQLAKNRESGAEARLGFAIEHEQGKRVLKDIIAVVDKQMRNSNEGMKFLLDSLPLIKTYGLEEAEFVANIKIGSYVWARISDVDAYAMADRLSPEARQALGPDPDPKRVKAKVFEELLLPAYERNLEEVLDRAFGEAPSRERTALRSAYAQLKAKALAGEATMEDFARLGEGVDAITFDVSGDMVDRDSAEAAARGHVGKAALMGIPWKARIGLDRSALFGLVDKLDKSRGLLPLLKRTGQKIGLALSI